MRKYEKSHPWLRFQVDLRHAPAQLWLLLGEARSKADHVTGAPLRPQMAKRFHRLFLAKGVLATAAIEGNTLSEKEVEKRIEGALDLPKSREYLGVEVDNVVKAMRHVWQKGMDGAGSDLSVAEIKEFNRLVLAGLTLEPDVVPGELRTYGVGVGTYQAPPAEDCEYLLERMCSWLNGFEPSEQHGGPVVMAILKAVLAHLYLAWIHPFGDGNGRTARMLEFKILTDAGVPSPAVHLLSNHYNQTRSEYYRQLERASKSGGDVLPFIQYAVQGFVDQVRMQVDVIRLEQLRVAWRSHVYERFGDASSAGEQRRRQLVLDLSHKGFVPRNRITQVSTKVAVAYSDKGPKTLTRDLNALEEMGLITRSGDSFIVDMAEVLAFLPESTKQGEYLKRLINSQEALMSQAAPQVDRMGNPAPIEPVEASSPDSATAA